jgi:hypothetical protein
MMELNSICNETTANITIILVFVISFLVFRYISKSKETRTHEQNQERLKEAEEYLNRHMMENEAFFLN